ncbi:MAG TPA: DUF58 domain-containing protein [Anaerolineaceae bacterium]|nr:DUF58 domain-containing protein [Anaerolineaceae bacterium]HPN52895.1 DUF58 domain-containing protein [Anaerolineaceae bacterium]
MNDYLPVLFALIIAAAALQQHFILSILYLITGLYIVGRWWSRRSLNNLSLERVYTPNAFLDQDVQVELEIKNRGLLPVVWVRLHESLPLELASPNFFRQVLSLLWRGQTRLTYNLHTHKRGCYALGPLFLTNGDLLGITPENNREVTSDYLTVYPKIIPIPSLNLSSRSPFGTIRHSNPIFEDTSRIIGKRDYRPGDSLRRVDWKTTAVTGRLQVKQYEASIALETHIFLDLDKRTYLRQNWFDASELAIVCAASLANWSNTHKQAVGLCTNGLDFHLNPKGQIPRALPPHKGSGHLMSVLETLARVQCAETQPFSQMIEQNMANLSWGTTMLLITGQYDQNLLQIMFQARRMGLQPAVFLIGASVALQEARREAGHFGFPVFIIQYADDLLALSAH